MIVTQQQLMTDYCNHTAKLMTTMIVTQQTNYYYYIVTHNRWTTVLVTHNRWTTVLVTPSIDYCLLPTHRQDGSPRGDGARRQMTSVFWPENEIAPF